MPKEQINYAPHVEGPDGSTPIAPEVSINWSSGEPHYAQIGFEFTIKDMLDYLTQLRMSSPTDHRATFYTPELTRPEMQRMIRAAKRARDSVFGADE